MVKDSIFKILERTKASMIGYNPGDTITITKEQMQIIADYFGISVELSTKYFREFFNDNMKKEYDMH